MNARDHEEIHRDLGVYVLGALEPAERDRLEAHLVACDACRDEVASLAVLPSLLSRAAPDGVDVPQPPPLGPIVGRIAEERRRTRRQTRLVAAAAALTAALAAVAIIVGPLPRQTPPGERFVADSADIAATVHERAWGMAVQIEATQLPSRTGFVAIAVAQNGHRTPVASWTDTGASVTVDGACYLAPSEVDRLEILAAPGDEVVAVLRPASE